MLYVAGYFAAVALFLFCWSRGLPPAVNHSRSFEKLRDQGTYGDVVNLPHALNTNRKAG